MFHGYDKFVQLCGSNREVLKVFKSSDFSVMLIFSFIIGSTRYTYQPLSSSVLC